MSAADDLLIQASLMLAVGAAQRRVVALAHSGLEARIAAARELCAALEASVAHLAASGAVGLRGSVEMAINEYATLGDLQAGGGGDASGASESFERGAELARLHGDAALRARIATDQAMQIARAGSPAKALAALFAARDALDVGWPAIPDGEGAPRADPFASEAIDPVLKVEGAMASFFRWLGDFDRSSEVVQQMRDRLAATETLPTDLSGVARRVSHDLRHIDLQTEGMMLAIDRAEQAAGAERQELLDEAQAALASLQPFHDGLGRAPGTAMRFQRCRILALRGDLPSALALLDDLMPSFDREPLLLQKRGMVHVHRARFLLDSGRGAQALAEAQAGVAGEEAYGQNETRWKAHWQLARARQAASPADAAAVLEAWDHAVAALGGIRTLTLGFRLDNLALRTARPMVDDAVACAASHGDGPRAARYADAVKSRFLALALRSGEPPEPRRADVDRLDELGEAIDAARARHEDITSAVAERAALIERMRLRASQDRPDGAPGPHELDLARTLAVVSERRQAALQLFLAGSVLTAVLLQDGAVSVRTRALSSGMLSALEKFECNLSIEPSENQHAPDYDPAAWQMSAETLLPPDLLATALRAQSLLVCPHGRLNLLPWAAMPCAGARLFDHVAVGTLPNLACIVPLAGRPLAAGRAALMGDTLTTRKLPFAGAEIDALAELYGVDGLVAPPCRGALASLASFRDLLRHAPADGAALHVSCHGSFACDDPAGAALHLSDRHLTAAEIALRPLRFREVTMSACSTGLRPSRIGAVEMLGDDILGLPASFLEAGASTVLSSITPAGNAASAALFEGYHRRRIHGAAPLAAFRATQRALQAGNRFPIGDWIGYSLISVH